MSIFKRNSYYHLEYFDEVNKIKRISTKCNKKSEALEFLMCFKKEIKDRKKCDFITFTKFELKYQTYTKNAMSEDYNKNIIYSFRILK